MRRAIAGNCTLAAVYLAAIVWVNAYLCRQVFSIEYTGQMHTMHGSWIALARLGGEQWLTPGWWPYWFGGMPFEFTYAPLVPALAAAYAKITGSAAALGFNVVSGAVFCLGPVALFLMAWRLTERPGWSFVAAMAYSLTAPTELLLPDGKFSLVHLGDARRFSVNFIWDEAPHHLALALLTLSVACLHHAITRRRPTGYVLAGLCMAGAFLANAFGTTALLLLLACYLPVCPAENRKRHAAAAGLVVSAAYLATCAYLPPSLFRVIRENAQLYPESAWTAASALTLIGVGCGWLALWRLTRKVAPWYQRFFLLFAYLTAIIPALFVWKGLHFIPQAGRYKTEMEMGLVLLAVFSLARLADRIPLKARIALAILPVFLAGYQIVKQRRFSKKELKAVEITQTIEYRTAKWVEANLPGRRVMAAGSIGQWMNAFSETQQFGGGSFPTAPNVVQQIAFWGLYSGGDGPAPDNAATLLWLKAFGVDAIIVPGPKSAEFWKPFREPGRFDGLLPLLWREQDTGIFAVPRPSASLAHAIPEQAVVRRQPESFADTAALRGYVAALDDPGAPAATLLWRGTNRATIRAEIAPGQALSVQVTHHPGWKAQAQGRRIAVEKDGLGQIVLRPGCAGACEIEMSY